MGSFQFHRRGHALVGGQKHLVAGASKMVLDQPRISASSWQAGWSAPWHGADQGVPRLVKAVSFACRVEFMKHSV